MRSPLPSAREKSPGCNPFHVDQAVGRHSSRRVVVVRVRVNAARPNRPKPLTAGIPIARRRVPTAPSAHRPTEPYVNAISAISSTSSFVVRTAIVRRHELVLLALLLAETFYLSVTLDTQPLIQIQSI